MEALERLTVHVREAVRLAKSDSIAELRIALLLFDSAAELLMHRQTRSSLAWNQNLLDQLEAMRRAAESNPKHAKALANDIAELERRAVSKTKVNAIDRDFGAKVDYLESEDEITLEQALVLRKFHAYRNDTYHRDVIRVETAAPAVMAYGFVVLSMMKQMLPGHFSGSGNVPRVVAEYSGSIRMDFDTQALVADGLLRELGFDPSAVPSEQLSEHVLSRLDEIDQSLDYVAEWVSDMPGRGQHDRDSARHLIQLPLKKIFEATTGADAKAIGVPVNRRIYASWRSRAESLATETNVLKLFGDFAALEDEFEPFEMEVLRAVRSVDREVEIQMERTRGS